MEYKELEHLLEKYWNAETSLDEEQQLKSFFQNKRKDDEFKEEAALFEFLSEEQEIQLDKTFDEKLFQKLKSDLYSTNLKKLVSGTKIRYIRYLSRAAATVALVLGAWLLNEQYQLINQPVANTYNVDTYEDPQLAYQEAKAALLLLSSTLNKGKKGVEKGMSKVNKTTKIIKNN